MTWFYSQKTGILKHNYDVESCGYSGKDEGKNNPDLQHVPFVGPIPRGKWKIGTAIDTREHGPFVLPLTPEDGTVTYGRRAFLIHGDSTNHPGHASEGCMIFAPEVRHRIASSMDNELEVTE